MALKQLWRERIEVGRTAIGITSANLVSTTGYSKQTILARFHHAGGGNVLGSADVSIKRSRGFGQDEWSPGARWEVSGDTDLKAFRMILPSGEYNVAYIDAVGYGDP